MRMTDVNKLDGSILSTFGKKAIACLKSWSKKHGLSEKGFSLWHLHVDIQLRGGEKE